MTRELPMPMPADELRASREQLGLTRPEMAFELGMEGRNGIRRLRRWETGEEPVSGPATVLVRLLIELTQHSA